MSMWHKTSMANSMRNALWLLVVTTEILELVPLYCKWMTEALVGAGVTTSDIVIKLEPKFTNFENKDNIE